MSTPLTVLESNGSTARWLRTVAVIFLAISVLLGWQRLHRGFCLMDEGMYVTDAWRMTMGDSLIPDAATSSVMLYVKLNQALLVLVPGADLMTFRRAQFVLTVVALAALLTLFVHARAPSGAFLVPALAFAFIGLDPNGFASNLSYYTWPHCLLCLHVAALVAGAHSARGRRRVAWLSCAGAALFLAGFALLPLAAAALVLPLLPWMTRHAPAGREPLTGRDVLCLLAPVALGWGIALTALGPGWVEAVLDFLRWRKSSTGASIGAAGWIAFAPRFSLLLLALCVVVTLLRKGGSMKIPGLLAVGVVVGVLLATNVGGVSTVVMNHRLDAQLGHAALVAVLLVACGVACLAGRSSPVEPSARWVIALAFPPTAAVAAAMLVISGLGPLVLAYVSFPVCALAVLGLHGVANGRPPSALQLVVVGLALFGPVDAGLVHSAGNSTQTDAPASQLTAKIEQGFARGVRTWPPNRDLAEWLRVTAERHSRPGDFALAAEQVSMVYPLIGRRPALNHSWTGLFTSSVLRREAVDSMVARGRHPSVAYLFRILPTFVVDNSGNVRPFGTTPYPEPDPIRAYVHQAMQLVEEFKVGEETWVELYVRKSPRPAENPPRP